MNMKPPVAWRFAAAALFAGTLAAAGCASAPKQIVTARDVRDAEDNAHRLVQMESSIRADTIPPRSVGVTPLRIVGADSSLASLGYGLADFIMADLARVSQLTVVNRLRFDAVLRELDLARAGRLDPATAPRVGKLVGAGRLITGTIGLQAQDNIGVGAQVVNSVTGAARPALTATTTMNQILRAQKDLTLRIIADLGVNLTPAERSAIEQFHTQDVGALLAYSRGVQHETEGRFAAAAREFRRASQLDPAFGLAGARAAAMQTLSAGFPLTNAVSLAGERLNPSLFNTFRVEQRGPADPAFPERSIVIRITITTPP